MKEYIYLFLFLIGLLTMIIKRITFEKEKGKEYTSSQYRNLFREYNTLLIIIFLALSIDYVLRVL
mgnify:FL=1|jgi:hypothetical protein